MRIDEIDRKVTQSDIQQLEKFADSLFGKVGIDVEFTRHFLDRVNDERNVKQITMAELTRLFKQEFKRWGKQIAQLGPDAEAVMKDMATDVNMPFALQWDSQNKELDLVAKTVMRKKDFKTSDPEFAVEGDFVHAISRFMNKSTRPGMYKRAAEKFHEWLKDQAPYRHSLGYYAMEWGNQYKNMDWRNLKQAYEVMFGDDVLVEDKEPKLVKDKKLKNLKSMDKPTKYEKRKNYQQADENFADGKNPERKGLSKRVGIPQGATLAQLEKIAKNSTGEKRRMAQWQLNMRRGKAKKKK